MKLKITEKKEKPLLEREEVRFEAEHENAPTPSRFEVLKELSSELGVSGNLIIIEKVATPHGRQTASGIARVYKSEESLKEFEPEYLIKRGEVSKEKLAEAEEVEEEVTEAEEEIEGGIDYQELSSQTISDIKEKAKELNPNYQKLLEVEKENKNRKTLIKWLKRKIEASEGE